MIDIDKLILEATKNKNNVARDTYRLIKAKFLEYKTSKGAKPMDDVIQINILSKMKKELEEDIKLYSEVNPELAKEYLSQLEVINPLVPAAATEEEITELAKSIIENNGGTLNMGQIIKGIKKELPNADGKLVAQIVKSLM